MRKETQHDKDIIRKARQGDREAFRELVQRYQNRVLSVAVQILGDPDGARDAAQEVFIRVFKSLESFNFENRFFTWLYRITVNVCYDILKREKRFRAQPLEEGYQVAESDLKADEDCENHILNLINRLPTNQKTAFLLREKEGLSCREIAVVLECPVGTVRCHLFYARNQLKTMITREYPEYLEGYES